MKQYYIYDNNQQHGPYTMDQLRAMPLRPDMLVWYEGLPQWTRCDQVQEIQGLFPPAPPTMSVQPAPPPVVQMQMQPQKRRSYTSLIVFSIVIALLSVAGYIWFEMIDHEEANTPMKTASASAKPKPLTREQLEWRSPEQFIELKVDWQYDLFTKRRIIVTADFYNHSTNFNYKDLVIGITSFTKSHTEIETKKYTLYEILQQSSAKNDIIFKADVSRYSDYFSFFVVSATPLGDDPG